MNQILDYGVGNGDNGGNPKKNGNNFGGNNFNNGKEKTPMSDKIIKVFVVLMLILAAGLIFSGVTSIMKNKEDSKKSSENVQKEEVTAEIEAELNEVTGKVKITIDSPITISKMIYSWDKEHESVVAGEKQTHLETEIIASYGEHVLHVQVIDEENNKTTKDFTIDSPTGIDTTNPKIVLTVTEDKKLLVSVTDDTSVGYVTYTWNNEETVTMTPEEEGQQEYEFELDIPRGKNTIAVVAVDGSDSCNVQTTTKVLEGVTKPVISPVLTSDSKTLQVTCTHEVGIKALYYTLNGNDYEWTVPEGETWPELSFVVEAVEGRNDVSIRVVSEDDIEEEWSGYWDYVATPTEEEAPSEEDVDNEGEDEILGSDETENLGSDETEDMTSNESEENN